MASIIAILKKRITLIVEHQDATIAFGESLTLAFESSPEFISNDYKVPYNCTYVISFVDEGGNKYYLYRTVTIRDFIGVCKQEIYDEKSFAAVKKKLNIVRQSSAVWSACV